MTDLLEKLKELFEWNKKELIIPKHIALTISGTEIWAKKNNKNLKESYDETFFNLYKIINKQIKLGIQSISILIEPDSKENLEIFEESLFKFFEELEKDKSINENKLKITVLGKWYQIPNKIVESIKNIMNKTKDSENNLLNICINYEGKQEIIDACKLIARKIESKKIKSDEINPEIFKQNLYTSNVNPVNLMINSSPKKIINSFLIWHSIGAVLYQSNKFWPEFNENDLLKAIIEYNKQITL